MLSLIASASGALFGGWRKWGALAGVGVLLAGGVYVQTVRLKAARAALALAERDRDRALEIAEANAEAARRVREQAAREIKALQESAASADARARHYETIRQGVLNASQSDDGPVAPVLRRVFDELRARKVGAGGTGRAGEGAGRPSDMRARTGAACGR